jgi:predicted RNA-binding protein Jag
VNSFQALENRIREQLKIFENPETMEFRFEPMDKDGRYVVHDVVDEYPELMCTAVGDYDERHVVVYRKGFVPGQS